MVFLFFPILIVTFGSENIPKFSYLMVYDDSHDTIERFKEEYDDYINQYKECNYDDEKRECEASGEDCSYIDNQIKTCKKIWESYKGALFSTGEDLQTQMSKVPSDTKFLFFAGRTAQTIDYNK